ncbi:MAG TPA: UDPGP type 1 family protein [Urbifossiella sp.]|jgi:UDP-N-acetylglucosamine/UDP-N-acetylgalactosamine diphosphorylase|nr:UDPGP type 1 family protein [Urbifossiella sp.]
MTHVPPELCHRLACHGQKHVLAGWDDLAPPARAELVAQLAGIDLAELDALYQRKDEPHTVLPPRERIAPVPLQPADAAAADVARGEDALRRGEVAALVVAGGQGTRLGSDRPKGMFPVGPVSGATLFRVHAEKVLALSRRCGKPVPFLVMTSPATHAETEAYFRAEGFFGLAEQDVFFFQQGTMPAVELATGRLLLEGPGKLFQSPNGHGGTLTALAETGLLADLKARGVRHVFYFQVDNPLVKVCDPGFVGRHVAADAGASSKVVVKEQPGEKVGILAVVDGRCGIIEYSDLPAEMSAEREPDGRLRFRAGSPAIHLFSVPFLERVTARGTGLAYHLARKKVPFYDPAASGVVEPADVNAVKFELFVFDALPMADRWLAVETPRAEEFAPLKNGTGPDSPETVRAAISTLHTGWLEAAGVPTHSHPVEVSPLVALDAAELRAKIPPGFAVTGPTLVSAEPRPS